MQSLQPPTGNGTAPTGWDDKSIQDWIAKVSAAEKDHVLAEEQEMAKQGIEFEQSPLANLDFKPLPTPIRSSSHEAPIAMALWKSNKGKDHPTLIIRLAASVLDQLGTKVRHHVRVSTAWDDQTKRVIFRLIPCELGEGTRLRPQNRFQPLGILHFPKLGEGLLRQPMRPVAWEIADDGGAIFITAPIGWTKALKNNLNL